MHEEMAYTIAELEQKSLMPGKTTAILATSAASMDCFLWAVFSLLLRSDPAGRLEHFMVSINGCDSRTGDTTLQDRKQAFVEELRTKKWVSRTGFSKDMPVSLIRAWSRVGHAASLEMAIPWVHTEFYTLMHDDVIVLDERWEKCIDFLLANKDFAFTFADHLLVTCLEERGETVMMPHPNTSFTTVHKPTASDLNVRWNIFHCYERFRPGDHPNFCAYHQESGHVKSPTVLHRGYESVTYDIGAWAYNTFKQAGKTFAQMPAGAVLHLGGASWGDGGHLDRAIRDQGPQIKRLEDEIYAHDVYGPLYEKYRTPTKKNSYPRPATGQPILNVVTAVSRPENLPALAGNIAKCLPGFDVRWHVMYDSHSCREFVKMPCWTEEMVSPGNFMGNPQKNQGLRYCEQGWCYFLDDDNLIHPEFNTNALAAIREGGEVAAVVFSQLRSDATVLAARGLRLGQVDLGMILAKSEAAQKSFFPNRYDSDFHFLKELAGQNRGVVKFVGGTPCTYHNALTSTSSTTKLSSVPDIPVASE